MEAEIIYDYERMMQDVRTYIALCIEWIRYHNEKMKNKSGIKKDKLNEDLNEYILRAWDNIDYFEKVAGKDITEAITDLTVEEIELIARAKNLRSEINSQNRQHDKNDNSNIDYMRKLIGRIKKAQDRLDRAKLNEEIDAANKDLASCYTRLGDMFMLYRVEPYIEMFTSDEQEYIYNGRMAKLSSDYAKEAEKARRFLKRCEQIQKAADMAAHTGKEFIKVEMDIDEQTQAEQDGAEN